MKYLALIFLSFNVVGQEIPSSKVEIVVEDVLIQGDRLKEVNRVSNELNKNPNEYYETTIPLAFIPDSNLIDYSIPRETLTRLEELRVHLEKRVAELEYEQFLYELHSKRKEKLKDKGELSSRLENKFSKDYLKNCILKLNEGLGSLKVIVCPDQIYIDKREIKKSVDIGRVRRDMQLGDR